jgi:hypothetical protein
MQLFEHLEHKHSKMFVSRAFAYITASSSGLSETELEDILSTDDTLLNDVFHFHVPPIIRIPPLLFVRLRHDIASYLVDREVDDITVFFWYHRQFMLLKTKSSNTCCTDVALILADKKSKLKRHICLVSSTRPAIVR